MIYSKKFDELTTDELYQIIKLRIEVFGIEQNCCYQDLDDYDYKCIHYFTKNNNEITSYARYVPKNLKWNDASIGRVVTNLHYRKQGLSSQIIKKILMDFKTEKLMISSQVAVLEFYKKLGFKETGDIYYEDKIPHKKMYNKC